MFGFEFHEVAIVGGFAALIIWEVQRRLRRRMSLRRDGDWYVWIGFDGTEGRSLNHPGALGGAWTSDGDADADDGGGGD